MKDKIIIFVIGILLGAVISTGAFYIYTITKGSNECDNVQMNGGQPPEMPNGQNGEPPEKPDGENGEPPEKPGQNNTENNTQ